MERGAAGRVARRQDHPRGAGDVERGAVAVRRHLADRRLPKGTPPQAEEEKRQERDRPNRAAALGRVRDLAPGQRGIELVDPRDPAPLASRPLGEADVVGMAMGEDERPNVVQGPAHRRELAEEVGPVAGHAGVDE